MKKLLVVILLLIPFPAMANDTGAWVKVDSNGNAIGQAIVCTPAVCGDPESLYNKLTLQPGERYVLQTVADTNGNVAGIGAGQRANTEVKVNLETKEWTATTKQSVEVRPIPIQTIEPSPEPTKPPKVVVVAETTVVEKINKNATTTIISQNAQLDTKVVATLPVSSELTELEDWYADFLLEWQAIFEQLTLLFGGWIWTW